MKPLVDARADDDHRAPLGFCGRVGELARDRDHFAPIDACNLFLPAGGVRHIVIEALGGEWIVQTPVDAVVREQQVVHGRHQGVLAAERHAHDRDLPLLHRRVLGTREVFLAEVGEAHAGDFPLTRLQQ